MKKLRPIFKMFGGKHPICHWIISFFPNNYEKLIYVEPFGGAGNVLLNKNPSTVEVYNELNPDIVNLVWHFAYGDEDFFHRIRRLVYDQSYFDNAKKLVQTDADQTSRAIAELILRRMSRSGMKQDFSWSVRERGGRPGEINSFENFKDELPKIKARLQNVIIRNERAESVIEQYMNDENVIFYVDPPYLHSTRTTIDAYEDFEMSEEQHIALANLLTQVKGKVILSSYPSELYSNLYQGWRLEKRFVKNSSSQAKKKQDRIECLWINYEGGEGDL